MEQLRKQVRRAQWWLGVQRFVHRLGWFCFATLLVAAGLIVLDKFRPLRVEPWVWPVGAMILGTLLAAAWAMVRGRGPMDAAIEIDRRFDLKERVSSSLAMSPEERQSEFGRALVDDAARRVRRINVGREFHVTPSRQLLLPLLPGLAVVLVAVFVNPAAAPSRASADADTAARQQVKKSTDALRRKLLEHRQEAEKRGLKKAEDAISKLEKDLDRNASDRSLDRKDALVKLNELSQELNKRRSELSSPEKLQEQLGQLKDIPKGPADKFRDEIAKGDLEKALKELQKLQQDLAKGKLDAKQQKALADQLQKMQDNLNKLLADNKKQQEQLKNQIQQARQAGDQTAADKLQQKLAQLQQKLPPANQVQQMAQKLGQCANCLKQGQGAGAADMLQQVQGDLKNLQQQANELQALDQTMDQLADARRQMTCKECGGAGCPACQGQGEKDMVMLNAGGGNKGRATGQRPEKKSAVNFTDVNANVKITKGQLSVVGEVEGPNARDDVQLQLREQFQSAKRESSDPLTEQKLPKNEREQARQYFDQFRSGK
jgi:hypothetical protein